MISPIAGEMALVRAGADIEAWWAKLMHRLWEQAPAHVAAVLDAPGGGDRRINGGGGLESAYERWDARLLSPSPDPLARGASTSGARRLLLSARFRLEADFADDLGFYAIGLTHEDPVERISSGAEIRWMQLRVGDEIGPSKEWLVSERGSGSATVEVAIERVRPGLPREAITTSICGINALSLHRSRCAVAARAVTLFSRALLSNESDAHRE